MEVGPWVEEEHCWDGLGEGHSGVRKAGLNVGSSRLGLIHYRKTYLKFSGVVEADVNAFEVTTSFAEGEKSWKG